MNEFRLGIDIGSTTLKVVVTHNDSSDIVFSRYTRHNLDINHTLASVLNDLEQQTGDSPFSVCITGSIGMGVAEKLDIPFMQEVVAASLFVRAFRPDTATRIDIGGEDGKMAFFKDSNPVDLRMNGNCAGGTGAFIDQMASLLDTDTSGLDVLARNADSIYPIASRCGVFSKTDIQNLMARNVCKEDIAASIFHAVSVQTVTTLARGKKVQPPVLMCGGPLTYLPSLRKAFADYLEMCEDDFIVPENSQLIPAWGCALCRKGKRTSLSELLEAVSSLDYRNFVKTSDLPPIFSSGDEYDEWKRRKSSLSIRRADLKPGKVNAYIGIDSGSTTTKIAVLDESGALLFSHYADNNGDPINAVRTGLNQLQDKCRATGTELTICGSCSTGYGEDLVKAAFRMDSGIVETMAHYLAAARIYPDVSFILDIGGQDMKAMFVDNGVINRIEVNEACSSGCGSFISTFARSMNCTVRDFAHAACFAPAPCDLGTRCTVFMNSKVKQVLREGTSVQNIAAGLTYSVVRNCLYKVLRLKDPSEMGRKIVVQGGTMRNDSVVRAFELLTGTDVGRSDCPELMGAVGCAYHAMTSGRKSQISLSGMLAHTGYDTDRLQCRGCQNRCAVTRFRFGNSNVYYSGNRCEKAFSNRGNAVPHGLNAYDRKRRLLFDRRADLSRPLMTLGIPRCLNTFEDYPFWHTLLTESNIAVVLSDESDFARYEKCAGRVMSDNICMPAKVVHSHIENLGAKGVDRIFMPFVIYEKPDKDMQNSYNCPIVSGYSQVIRSVGPTDVPVDSPTFSFKERSRLYGQCVAYLTSLGVARRTVKVAFAKAVEAQQAYERDVIAANEDILNEARAKGSLVVMLAGRPYHADVMIQHKVAEMISAHGAYVITDDYVRDKYLTLARDAIRRNDTRRLYDMIDAAAAEFDAICADKEVPKVGIVGEIFLKYHPFAQRNTTAWLVENGLEVVYPALTDFFMQGLVNMSEQKKERTASGNTPDFIIRLLHDIGNRYIGKVNRSASRFRYYIPLDDIFDKAETAREAITLSARFGEGWLIAGEIGMLARQGVSHFVSLQPFGCIANHIVQKGIENRLKTLYPHINILTLDFDSSVSEANIANRLLLFVHNIHRNGNH